MTQPEAIGGRRVVGRAASEWWELEGGCFVHVTARVGRGVCMGEGVCVGAGARIRDNVWIAADANIGANARVPAHSKVAVVGPLGRTSSPLTMYRTMRGHEYVTGCFRGTFADLEAASHRTHGPASHDYRAYGAAAVALWRIVMGNAPLPTIRRRKETNP